MNPIKLRINITSLTHKCITSATILCMISYAILSMIYINHNKKYIDIEINNITELENGNIAFDSQFGKLELKKEYYNRVLEKDSTHVRLNSLVIPDLLQNEDEKNYVIKEKLKLDDTYLFNSIPNTFTLFIMLMLFSALAQVICFIFVHEVDDNCPKFLVLSFFLLIILTIIYGCMF